MPRRRTLVFALFAIAAAVVLAVGSGAFSTVDAQRTVTVDVAGDDSALLQLTPHSGPNGAGAYAQQSNGQLEVLVDGSLTPGSGVNQNAVTTIRNVFNITNQGSQPVGVWIVKSGAHSGLVTFEDASESPLDNSSSVAKTVGVGDTVQVSLVIDTTGQSLSDGDVLLSGMTVHADVEQA